LKVKDIKHISATTVGEVKAFLAQFPDDMPIKAHAEVDACSEEGYGWIGLGVEPKRTFVDHLYEVQADGSKLTYTEIDKRYEEAPIAEVTFSVDH